MGVDDSDDFHVVRRAVLWRLRITNVLPERVCIREKLFRHLVVNDCDARRILVLRFSLSEIAAAQKLDADRVEVPGRRRGVKRTCARIRRFRVGWHHFARRHDATRACEVAVRQHRSERRGLDAR